MTDVALKLVAGGLMVFGAGLLSGLGLALQLMFRHLKKSTGHGPPWKAS